MRIYRYDEMSGSYEFVKFHAASDEIVRINFIIDWSKDEKIFFM